MWCDSAWRDQPAQSSPQATVQAVVVSGELEAVQGEVGMRFLSEAAAAGEKQRLQQNLYYQQNYLFIGGSKANM